MQYLLNNAVRTLFVTNVLLYKVYGSGNHPLHFDGVPSPLGVWYHKFFYLKMSAKDK